MRIPLLLLGTLCLVLALNPAISFASKKKKTVAPVKVYAQIRGTLLPSDVQFYLTTADQSAVFEKQRSSLYFTSGTTSHPIIDVDTAQTYQTIEGFGFALTGGSATLINQLPETNKNALLDELFRYDSTHIGVSYLRISIGASDLSATTFTYNDMPVGQTDTGLSHFSIAAETIDLIPILKKIIAINPSIKILGSPWSAPAWMKTNGSLKGGSLKPACYNTYATYLAKYILAMQAEGITIDAITPQNEPLHGGNNPSMVMTATEQCDFIKNSLGPMFTSAGIATKIIAYDHNADTPEYPLTIYKDTAAAKYVDGSAFHLYAGSINALTQVHDAYPNKHVYFTEQWVGGPSNFAGDLSWHVANLIIGATRNWSRNVLEWNLASDSNYRPHTVGGCTNCLGALTISGTTVSRNVGYYIIASASKFVRPGSVRIASNHVGKLLHVAFKNPDGQKILIVLNSGTATEVFDIRYRDKIVTVQLASGSVGTFVW